MLRLLGGFVLLHLLAGALLCQTQAPAGIGWPIYGGDAGGQRYSASKQITKSNVSKLRVAWTFHTGTFRIPSPYSNHRANFEATPVLWEGKLYFDTPFDQVFSINAVTGKKIWSYDPQVNRESEIYIVSSRGVALWHGSGPASIPCGRHRVFVATLDRRLIARDAATGQPCEDFGQRGTVDLTAGLNLTPFQVSMYGFTSPPTVVGDVVVLGSSVGDNQSVSVAPGVVRGYDVRTGRQIWSWDPMPWSASRQPRTGGGNAWSILSADPQRDLVFVPTGSPATDYFGGQRPGDNRDADSIVALRASTGQKVWAFQLVHHDLWDYDTPSEPMLFTFRGKIPAVAVTTKTGMIFVFNRVTGEPLYPIEERPVPQTDLPGETTSRTQPFSTLPTLTRLAFGADDLTITDPAERATCKAIIARLINKGIFTPPSVKPTLIYPGSVGGANWGSPGLDPATNTLYVHTNSLAYVVQQIPKQLSFWERVRRYFYTHWPGLMAKTSTPVYSPYHTPDGGEHSPQTGTAYQLYREALSTPRGTPCSPQPWGALVAVNLDTGSKQFSVAQGTMIAGEHTGSVGVGGPAVTAGGLVFLGATLESVLRGFDSNNGAVLWEAQLPAPAIATPMTYQIRGKQFLVVAAGGYGMFGTGQDDSLLAFALQEPEIRRSGLANGPSALRAGNTQR
jgi:quinoprotein glucose dehydrogenase